MKRVLEADGLADLGLWEDAWAAISEKPSSMQAFWIGLRVRLRCCAPLGAWETGEQIAQILRDSVQADRRIAADFYIARAKQDPTRARHWLHEAIETWPECEELIMKNPELFPPSEDPSQNSLSSA